MARDKEADSARQFLDLALQADQTSEEAAREPGLHAVDAAKEPSSRRAIASRDEIGDRSAISWNQCQQVRVHSIASTGGLGHQVLAGFKEQSEVVGPVRKSDRRQVRFARGHTGDRQRITRIALARPARPLALDTAEVRRHFAYRKAGLLHRPGERSAERGRPRRRRSHPARWREPR